MQLVPYTPAHVSGVYDVYCLATAKVPHCRFVPSLEYMSNAIERAVQAGTAGLLVADDGGSVRGVATFRPVAPDQDGIPEMEINGLFAVDETITTMLLEACLVRGRTEGARKFVAFPAEHGHCLIPSYNAGWDGLSDQLPVVARVLARHGFGPFYRELHLECAGLQFPPPPMAAPAGTALVEGTEDGYITVRAMVDEKEAGIVLYMLVSKYSDHPEAGACGYVDWLHVDEAHRRRGLGRYLMTWTLRRLQAMGCDRCWLTTGGDNWPAQPLYLGLGFEILDTSSSWGRGPGEE